MAGISAELKYAYSSLFLIGAILTVLVLVMVYDLYPIPSIFRGWIYGFFGIIIWIVGLAVVHILYIRHAST